LTNNNRQDIAFARQVAATIVSFQIICWDDLKCRQAFWKYVIHHSQM